MEQRAARLKNLHGPATRHYCGTALSYALLHAAMEGGNVDRFIEALEEHSAENGVSLWDFIEARGPSGSSLLHIAAGSENPDILLVLLEVIPDERRPIGAVNSRGDTALHVAVRAGRIRSAELLLDCGSEVDKANETGDTPLHEAVKNGNHELTNLLLRRGSTSVYKKNSENKCPLYLAVEAGDLESLKLLLQALDGNRVQGKSPVHGAVMLQKMEMLQEMSRRKKELFDITEGASRYTPLHAAANVSYVDGVTFLVQEFPLSAVKRESWGYLPIHIACKRGHVKVIEELLQRWPVPEELLILKEDRRGSHGQNILHVAAKYGKAPAVGYILGNPKLEKLINAKDVGGNTPLHVATSSWQPEVLLLLARDKRVNVELVNNGNMTALDIVDEVLKEMDAQLLKRLMRIILVSAGTRKSRENALLEPVPLALGPWDRLDPGKLDQVNNEANTRMVVATLIAGVTFAAGFSVPGGYNGSEPDAGIATLLNKPMYNIFVICNSIAMYSSIIAVVILFWTQIPDPKAGHHALRKARIPLMLALASMSVAFMAGVYVTVSKRTWIAVVILTIGIAGLFFFLSLYVVMYMQLGHYPRLVQPFTDRIIRAVARILKVQTDRANLWMSSSLMSEF